MSRAKYKALRAQLAKARHDRKATLVNMEFADSPSYCLRQEEKRWAAVLREISMQIPVCRDPLCFRIMYENWQRRRSHVMHRIAERKADAIDRAHATDGGMNAHTPKPQLHPAMAQALKPFMGRSAA